MYNLLKFILLNIIMIYYLKNDIKYSYLILFLTISYLLYLNSNVKEGYTNFGMDYGDYIPNSYVIDSNIFKKYIYGFYKDDAVKKEYYTISALDYLIDLFTDELDEGETINTKIKDNYKLKREEDIIYDYKEVSDDSKIQYSPRKVWVDGPERNLRLDYDRDNGLPNNMPKPTPGPGPTPTPGPGPTPPPHGFRPTPPAPSHARIVKPPRYPSPGPKKTYTCTNIYDNALGLKNNIGCSPMCVKPPTFARCKDPSCNSTHRCYKSQSPGAPPGVCSADTKENCKIPANQSGKAYFCPMPPASPVIYSPGPKDGGWTAVNPPNRLLNFNNKTGDDIVIIGMLGDPGYYSKNAENTLPESWKWLTNTSNTIILGDTAGVNSEPGWNAFVITSLKSGSNVSIIFPLLNASYSSNLTKNNKFGLSGGAILAVKNDSLSQGNFSVATKNVTRFEYTFQLDKSDKVDDFLNISAIPQGCGGHLNCNATNFNSNNNINYGDACIDVPYSYNFKNNKYYYGKTVQPIVVTDKGEPGAPHELNKNYVGPFVCGLPQVFSQEVIDLCNRSPYSQGVKLDEPGGGWKNKADASNIKNCGITSSYQCMLNQLYYNNTANASGGMGINYDLIIKSNDSLLKSLITPTTGGYKNQQTWDISCLIDNGAWKGTYGYPYQEELETNILSSNINTVKSADAYALKDLVMNNKLNDGKVSSTLPKNKTKIGETVVYDLTYQSIGSGKDNKKYNKCILKKN